jgi:hypothetical protein
MSDTLRARILAMRYTVSELTVLLKHANMRVRHVVESNVQVISNAIVIRIVTGG